MPDTRAAACKWNHSPRIGIVTNPAADNGRGKKIGPAIIRKVSHRAYELGCTVIDLTGHSREKSALKISDSLQDLDILIVAGGDGMVNLGMNAVAHTRVALGIIACGSGNDFARSTGLPVHRIDTSIEAVFASIMMYSFARVDLIHVTSADDAIPDGYEGDIRKRVNTYIAGSLNCSIDAAINLRANASGIPVGKLRYGYAGIAAISHPQAYGFSVSFTDLSENRQHLDLETPLFVISNAPYMGSGIRISPYSSVTDSTLDMVWAKWMPTPAEGMHVLFRAYSGAHLSERIIGWQQIRSAKLRYSGSSAYPPVLMGDGEVVGELPVKAECVPSAARMLLPPRIARSFQQ